MQDTTFALPLFQFSPYASLPIVRRHCGSLVADHSETKTLLSSYSPFWRTSVARLLIAQSKATQSIWQYSSLDRFDLRSQPQISALFFFFKRDLVRYNQLVPNVFFSHIQMLSLNDHHMTINIQVSTIIRKCLEYFTHFN